MKNRGQVVFPVLADRDVTVNATLIGDGEVAAADLFAVSCHPGTALVGVNDVACTALALGNTAVFASLDDIGVVVGPRLVLG